MVFWGATLAVSGPRVLELRPDVLHSTNDLPELARLVSSDAFPSLAGATDWINSAPLKPADLRGKVVLVEFWTFTCINWRRESPYVRAWSRRYGDKGLVVIGVHSPEFEFEKSSSNVRRAVKEIGIDYPVAVDSGMGVWSAFGNEYWPALYFIDATGHIRGRHFGEGDYDKSERLIRQLLAEAGRGDLGDGLTQVDTHGAELAADLRSLMSSETYLGYDRTTGFASFASLVADRPRVYATPEKLRPNQWGLEGDWVARKDAVVSNGAPASVIYRFHARDVDLVMGPSRPGAVQRFRVSVDGRPPGAAHGVDVDSDGVGTLDESRVYQLIRQQGEIIDRRFEIEFLDRGAAVYDFTFG